MGSFTAVPHGGYALGGSFSQPLDTLSQSQATVAQGGGGTASGGGGFGYAAMIVGALTQIAGAYYSAEMARERGKMHALNIRFAEKEAARNARAAESDAQLALESGQREVGRLTLGVGAAKAAKRARAAASGLRLNAGGSVAEGEASQELVKQIDVFTIRRNAVRAANASRTRRSGFASDGLILGASARNAERSADAISPLFDAGVAAAGAASNVALNMARDRRLATYLETV